MCYGGLKMRIFLLFLVLAVTPAFGQSIIVDYNHLPITHLIVLAAVVFAFLGLLSVIFTYGLTFKWGDKEIVIGAIKRLLAKKDEDIRLKEELKRFTDGVDNDIANQLYDLVDGMDFRLEKIMVKEHCFFSFGEFIRLVQEELKKRIRRNNLKERMAGNRETYAEKILHDVHERYKAFQYKSSNVPCHDTFEDFDIIEEALKKEIEQFMVDAAAILTDGMKKKINRYEETKPQFKTKEARKFCCDDCISKNIAYIKSLAGGNYKPEATK
jgi:hypothetical protein